MQPPRRGGLSVIIPAHNESRSLPRLLSVLVADNLPRDVEVLVVCNGCTDDTADVARRWAEVQVLEIAEASKNAAMLEGDRYASFAARAFVDADVVITQQSILALYRALEDEGVLAAAPTRNIVLDNASILVRWYYDVWQELPHVRAGLFGRGVIVLSAMGHERVNSLPKVMSDDLIVSEAFSAAERSIVGDAVVSIRVPLTIRDLVRRRARISTGNAEMDGLGLRAPESRTSMRVLLDLVRQSYSMLPKVSLFAVIALAARTRSSWSVRTGDFTTWLRDESSRAN